MRRIWKRYIGDLFIRPRGYALLVTASLLFLLRYFLVWLGQIPYLFLGVMAVLFIADYLLLFARKKGFGASRAIAERMSNGDQNEVNLYLESRYPFPTQVEIIDEIPHQFQKRDVLFKTRLEAGGTERIQYHLRPVKRGEYEFGKINGFLSTAVGLVERRFQQGEPITVPVYPSYLQMRKYQLMAISNRLSEVGVKKIRRIGHTMEFEQIKEYVRGDDYRTINWKATARKGQLMMNNYTDEKSQQIYCVIDKGRVMKMPFEELSLLDYAINASLVLSNVALLKQDKAGIISFAEKISAFLPAEKKATQMQSILELLYNQKTRYLESDFEKLYASIRNRISQRSLIVLFTNFESLSGMQRQLPYLRRIAQHHLLLVVFFENTELRQLIDQPASDLETVYTRTIAEKFAYEKKLIVKELQRYGIISILTAPRNVTVNTLNKYLELKARQAI